MRYHVTACMTLISALLGFLYSLRGVRNCKGGNDKAFSYMAARSFALLILAVVPIAERSVSALVLITFSMMIVQVIDRKAWQGHLDHLSWPCAILFVYCLSCFLQILASSNNRCMISSFPDV